MSAAITLDDDPAQPTQGSATADEPGLQPAQERILAELVYSARQSAPALRFAAVPIDDLRELPIFGQLARTWRRSQGYLRRAAREWYRRTSAPQTLSAAAERVISEGVTRIECPAVPCLVTPDAPLEPSTGLLSALALDRSLIGDARKSRAARAFIEELDRQLQAFERAYPATVLEQIDIERARRVVRDALICASLRLAKRRASAVAWRSRLPLEDLVQIGAEGLIHAADRFDPRYGAPFAAYATLWIKQQIARGERTADLVPLPNRLQAARGRIRRALARSLADGSAATSIAIAARLALPERVVEAVVQADAAVISLDGVAGLMVRETCADDAPTAHDHVHSRQRRQAVRQVLAALGCRERTVVELMFGIGCAPMPVTTIALKLGLSKQRVYQISNTEIRRLRRPPVLVLLKDYA
jgi:RNA polymerase primary sigma factor